MKNDRFLSNFSTKEQREFAVSAFLVHLQYLFDIEAMELIDRERNNHEPCKENYEAVAFLNHTRSKIHRLYS